MTLDGRLGTVVGSVDPDFDQGSNGDGGPAANALLAGVTGMSLDREGSLYFADRFNRRIRKVHRALECPIPVRPLPAVSGLLNAASYVGSVAPGTIFTLFGRGLGPAEPVVAEFAGDRLPTEIAGVRVEIDETPVPLLFVSAEQLSGVVPYTVPVGVEVEDNITRFFSSSELFIRYDGAASELRQLSVYPAVPGIFTLDQSGSGQGAILNQDGTVNGPENPAAPGTVIVLFGTGGGAVAPAGEAGRIAAEPLGQLVGELSVWIENQEAEILYAGDAPGLVSGVIQLNVRLPEILSRRGAVPIEVRMGARPPQYRLTVTVGP